MATVILLVIYIAFIGLGIPDSLFGTAWPAIYPEFGADVGSAGFVTLIISGCTVISSLFAARIINRFGVGIAAAFSTALTAAALLGFSLSNSLYVLCLLSVPLGLGAGCIDSGLNNYVALHYKASHMSFLHCFYGIGVTLSPYLMSLALAGGQWRRGYRFAFYIQLAITVVLLIAIPFWDGASRKDEFSEASVRTLKISEMLKMPSVRASSFVFFGSCALENVCGTWSSTYLVNTKGMTADTAALLVMLYYAGMAAGRFLSGVLACRMSCRRIIKIGQSVVLLAIIMLFLPLPREFSGAALFMIGIGNGPLFPNMVHLTPKNFGAEISQSVMGMQMAVAYLGIMSMPLLFGFIAGRLSSAAFPYFISAMYLILIVSGVMLEKILKSKNRYI